MTPCLAAVPAHLRSPAAQAAAVSATGPLGMSARPTFGEAGCCAASTFNAASRLGGTANARLPAASGSGSAGGSGGAGGKAAARGGLLSCGGVSCRARWGGVCRREGGSEREWNLGRGRARAWPQRDLRTCARPRHPARRASIAAAGLEARNGPLGCLIASRATRDGLEAS